MLSLVKDRAAAALQSQRSGAAAELARPAAAAAGTLYEAAPLLDFLDLGVADIVRGGVPSAPTLAS
eukprot:SAG11_NODE_2747_length_3012_cov_1.881909_2_plen_66_part_00